MTRRRTPHAAPSAAAPTTGCREFVTPEGVDLRLRIGAAGERAAAFLLDAVIIVVALIALTVLAIAAAARWPRSARRRRNELGSVVLIVWLLGFFLLRNGYFIALRAQRRARRRRASGSLGLRVAARDGGRLTAEAIFARNAMREIEVFLPLTFLLASGAGATTRSTAG